MGLLKALVGGALASEERVRDDLDKLGEREDVLVGTTAIAVEDVAEEVVGGAEVEETEDGIGERQTLTEFAFKGLHGVSLLEKKLVPGDNLCNPNNLCPPMMFSRVPSHPVRRQPQLLPALPAPRAMH